ncbi:MAG: hypothetical protein HY924_08305 [Elusimicrobia bacterium]|nr:hypothetical protein [Elusimicrobiota bacterium]
MHRVIASAKGRGMSAVLLTASVGLAGAGAGWGIYHRVSTPAPASGPGTPAGTLPAPAPGAAADAGDHESVAEPSMTAPPAKPRSSGDFFPPAADSGAAAPQKTDARPPMVERTPPRRRLQAKGSSTGVYESGKEVDGFRPLRLVTHDPQAEAARMFATQRPALDADNTDISRRLETACAAGLNCGRDAKGRFYYTTPDGTRTTQTSYDQSKPLGERNELLSENPLTGVHRTHKCSPLVFDLKGSGVRSSDRLIRFSLTGDGDDRIYDIASDAGVLVFDADKDGIAGENGRELFGDVTDLDGDRKPDGYYEGFEALTAMVGRARRQGVLPPHAPDLARLGPEDLAKLGKAYGLGMRVGGLLKKTVSLQEAGVRELVLSASPSVLYKDFDGQGDDVVRREGARFIRPDGSEGAYEDVFFRFEKTQLRKVVFDAAPSGGATRVAPTASKP